MFQMSFDPTALNDYRSPFQILESLENQFFLTGSRRFGGAREKSDYDFFVQDDGKISEILISHGFKKVSDDERYNTIPNTVVFRKGNVDVQVRKNADEFEKINQWLETNPNAYKYMRSVSPEQRNKLWMFLTFVV